MDAESLVFSSQTDTGVWPGLVKWLRDELALEWLMLVLSGCSIEMFASKKIPEALVPTAYRKWGCPRITGGPSLASATDVPGGRRPLFPDLWL